LLEEAHRKEELQCTKQREIKEHLHEELKCTMHEEELLDLGFEIELKLLILLFEIVK
jgi:hypothetical protein